MKAILSQNALRVALAAASGEGEKERPVMGCIRISRDAAVGSDGYMLAAQMIHTETEAGNKDESILIRAEDLLRAKAIFPKGEILLETDSENKEARLTLLQGSTFELRVAICDYHYPRYDHLGIIEPKARIAIDKSLLERALKVLKSSDTRYIRILVKGESDPIELKVSGTSVYIMPAKLAEAEWNV